MIRIALITEQKLLYIVVIHLLRPKPASLRVNTNWWWLTSLKALDTQIDQCLIEARSIAFLLYNVLHGVNAAWNRISMCVSDGKHQSLVETFTKDFNPVYSKVVGQNLSVLSFMFGFFLINDIMCRFTRLEMLLPYYQ